MILSLLLAGLLQTAPTSTLLPEGVFRSRGYGWVIDHGPQGLKLYQEAGRACWPNPDESVTDSFGHAVDLGAGVVGLSETGDDQATVYVFDALPSLPAACLSPATGDREAVFAIADLMAAYYPAFGSRGVDFDVRQSAMTKAWGDGADADRAFANAEALLAGLDDPHIQMSADIGGVERAMTVSEGRTLDAIHARPGERPERAWLTSWRTGVEQTILSGQGHVAANNRLFWGVRDNVGYLAVVTMGAFDPEDDAATAPLDMALDEAMAAFAGTRVVVVDVSNNRGGYDSVSRRIAARFADRPRVAYLKRGWGAGTTYQTVEVGPSDRPRYLGPVWLLTSDITVSAGETFSQMMRVLPNVLHAGTRTRGAFSDQTPVALPNGWSFAMPMEIYVDPQGLALEGHGLEPSVKLDLYPSSDLDHGHAMAVSGLMRRLAR